MKKMKRKEKNGKEKSQIEKKVNMENVLGDNNTPKGNAKGVFVATGVKQGTRDTTGDTKIFKAITREDIEREKKRQAISAENTTRTAEGENGFNRIENEKYSKLGGPLPGEVSQAGKSPAGTLSEGVSQVRKTPAGTPSVGVSQVGKALAGEPSVGVSPAGALQTGVSTTGTSSDSLKGNFGKNGVKNIENRVEKLKDINKMENKNVQANNSNVKNIEKDGKNVFVAKSEANVKAKNDSMANVKAKNDSKANVKTKPELNNTEKKSMVVTSDNKALKPASLTTKKNKSNKKQVAGGNKSSGSLKAILLLLILILVILVFSTIFGIKNMNSDKIVKGVRVNNVEVSNLNKEEAVQKLNNTINNSENNYIVIKHGEYATKIQLEDIEGKFDTEVAVNTAFAVGRNSNIVVDNFKTVEAMVKGVNVDAGFTYNQELLEKKIDEISLEIPDLATESSYVITDNKVVIKNSKNGVVIKKDEFIKKVIQAFKSGDKTFELPVENVEKQKIDIESIHNEVYKAPIDASFTTNPYKLFKEEEGLDFAISLDEAKQLVEEDRVEFEIELVTLKPKVTVADLGDEAFPDVLATFTTSYGTGDVARNTNIAIAARSINSAVVMPGEEFSYNDLIGECSTRTGYKESTIYLNGKLSTGVGGGICQVSTTLYNAVLRANLEIVQRRNHSLGVTYVPAGQDAMVNIGTSDFKFKNNRDYPVKVVAFVGTGTVTCEIHGLKQDVEYEVKLESRTIEKNDTRYKVETYKVLYLNGSVVSRTWLSTDTYKYH